jgi:hypothetical protein
VRLPSVDTDEGEHEYAEATKVDDAAGVEDVILCCGRFFCWSKGHQMACPTIRRVPAAIANGPALREKRGAEVAADMGASVLPVG